MDARANTDNPLGLNLDFVYGRGYLWAEAEHVSHWVTLERLRMEIPDLSFPFDVRGGLDRFRNTRCWVQELDLAVDEAGVAQLLRGLSGQLDGFHDLDVRFLDGVALLSARVSAFGDDTFLTFRLAPLPGRPGGSDEIELLAHDPRAYGPMPLPARQLVHTLLERIVEAASAAIGGSFALRLEDGLLRLRPLKLVLLHVFGRHGWKLPNLSRVEVGDLLCQPGSARIRARGPQEDWTRDSSTGSSSSHLSHALAAEEARHLFREGDRAVAAGRLEQALRVYQSLQDRYRMHTGLVERIIDVLLSSPEPANVSEAESLIRDLDRQTGESLVAARARARLAEITGSDADQRDAYRALADLLSTRGETVDRALCEVVAARASASTDDDARTRLWTALRVEPRNRAALLQLRDILARQGRHAELEDVLKRLTGVAGSDEDLIATYLQLASHLIETSEPDEARVFLQRALRVAPDDVAVLDLLGESWVRSSEPARAVKMLGGAAQSAIEREDFANAAALLARIAGLWSDALDNPDQALLQIRRAIDIAEQLEDEDALERAHRLTVAARLCDRRGLDSDAVAYWTETLAALELAESRTSNNQRLDVRRRLAQAHREIAAAYRKRGRLDVAATHDRRLVEMDPTDVEAIDSLEAYYREHDTLERFARVLREAVDTIGNSPESVELRQRLAQRYVELDRSDQAAATLEQAMSIAPGSERIRANLTGLLRETEQLDRLRRVLEMVLDRVQQRGAKWALAMELGDLHEELGDPQAALKFRDMATHILPARDDAYDAARRLLETDAADRGWDARSSLSTTTGSALLDLLQRQVDAAPDARRRTELLDQLASIAATIGDDERAREATELREESAAEVEALEQKLMEEDSDWSEATVARDEVTDENDFDRGTRRTRLVTEEDSDEVDGNKTSVPRANTAPAPPARKIQSPQSTAAAQADAPSGDQAVESFRNEFEAATRKPPKLRDLGEVGDDSPLARILRRRPTAADPETLSEASDAPNATSRPEAIADPEGDDPITPELDRETLEQAIREARKDDDFAALADALESLLTRVFLEDGERAELAFELGELLYYDLEDGDRALDWLLEVRKLDPTGYGAKTGVLNAIEAIYEERGSVDGRVEILRARLEQASSDELADTYRLLLAQLEWEERDDVAAARTWLDEVIARDDRHEGARRLLADVAIEQNEWAQAAEHLRIALSVSGDGLDSIELRKRLARLLVEELDRPADAKKHFEQVLRDAPGDTAAVQGLRACLKALGDWDGYVASLADELRLLLGRTLSPDEEADWFVDIETSTVPDPLRIPASQVLGDIARVHEEERDAPESAHRLWGVVHSLWGEHVEALERRIDLGRKLEDHVALAADLELYAEVLLDAAARFEALVEAATVQAEELSDLDAAATLVMKAIRAGEDSDDVTAERLNEATGRLKEWTEV